MTKVRKQKRKKVFRFSVNRKRQNKRRLKTPNISCIPLKKAWDRTKSVDANFKHMGLSCDPSRSIAIPSNKPIFTVTPTTSAANETAAIDKLHVAMELDEEAKAPRVRKFRLPNSQIYWLSKLMDNYGEDYKAMARDPKMNHFQQTWKQLRQKIKVFKGIPEQYDEYMKSKQLPVDLCDN